MKRKQRIVSLKNLSSASKLQQRWSFERWCIYCTTKYFKTCHHLNYFEIWRQWSSTFWYKNTKNSILIRFNCSRQTWCSIELLSIGKICCRFASMGWPGHFVWGDWYSWAQDCFYLILDTRNGNVRENPMALLENECCWLFTVYHAIPKKSNFGRI